MSKKQLHLKKRLFRIMEPAERGDTPSRIFDLSLIVLIIVNVVIIIVGTFDELPADFAAFFRVFENISQYIFLIEYILRVWTSDLIYPELSPGRARLRYIRSGMAVIDLVALLPLFAPGILPIDLMVLRSFRVLRVLRIFKLNHYTDALSAISDVFKKKSHQIVSSLMVMLVLMLVTSVLMYYFEHPYQPEVYSNAFSGFWWSMMTLTTVGYGDIYPVTVAGKIMSCVIAVLGIGLIAIPTGIVSSGFMQQTTEAAAKPAEPQPEEKKYCPYCGKRLD